MKRIKTIWHPSYYQPTAASWLSTRKQKDVVEGALNEGLIEIVPNEVDPASVWDSIKKVHDPIYVEAVRTGNPRSLAESQGFNWSRGWADSVARIWAGQRTAALLALQEGIAFHPVSGSHHAERSHGGGFCTFNHQSACALAVLDAGLAKKCLILDVDAHSGNGTFDLVGGDPRIVQFDLGAVNFGTPICDDIEAGRFYEIVDDHERYFAALERLPKYLDVHHPDLVVAQFGMDCHVSDMGAIDGLDAERLAERDRFIARCCRERSIPMVGSLAGGYIKGVTVGLHVQTIRELVAEYACA